MLDSGTYMGIDKEFEELIFKLYKQRDEEIFFFDYKNKRFWLKKARATKSLFIHKIFYKIFPIEVLLPVENKSAKDALEFETNKIEEFKKLNIGTPNIVFKNNDFFVLEDCGKNINSNIRKKDISQERMYFFIDKLLEELSKIHNQNHFHGGAQTRNFTFKDEKVFTIDLEDSFDSKIDLKTLQLRDLILVLLSLTKTRASFDVDYEYVINKYIEFVPANLDFKNKLKNLAGKISFLTSLSQVGLINKLIGRDGKGFFKLFIVLGNLEVR